GEWHRGRVDLDADGAAGRRRRLGSDKTVFLVRTVAIGLFGRAPAAAQKGSLGSIDSVTRPADDLECAGHLKRAIYLRRNRQRTVARGQRLGLSHSWFAGRREACGGVAAVTPGFVLGRTAAAQSGAKAG